MTPPPRKLIPPRRKSEDELQINRTFDSVGEIESYLITNFPGKKVSIAKTWEVKQLACVVKIEG